MNASPRTTKTATSGRRHFLKQATAATAVTAGATLLKSPVYGQNQAPSPGRVIGANDRIVVAVIGLQRGRAHINGHLGVKNVDGGFVCDVDSARLAEGRKLVTTKRPELTATGVGDYRRLLENKAIDVISIATPNYWHAIMAIQGCEAGKHVYVEKPGSHNPFEAEAMVAAAKRSGRVVQMGNQRRSYHFRDDQETPDTGALTYDFGDSGASWDFSSCIARKAEANPAVIFYGEKGSLQISYGNDYTIFDPEGKELEKKSEGRGADAPHFQNFTDAIRLGAPRNSPIAEGQKSTMLCHLGNIAYRLGRTLEVDPKTGRILNDPAAMKLWKREYRAGWEPKGARTRGKGRAGWSVVSPKAGKPRAALSRSRGANLFLSGSHSFVLVLFRPRFSEERTIKRTRKENDFPGSLKADLRLRRRFRLRRNGKPFRYESKPAAGGQAAPPSIRIEGNAPSPETRSAVVFSRCWRGRRAPRRRPWRT